MNETKKYEYDAILHEDQDSGGAYVIFPWDLKKEFGKGRVKVHAEFDGMPYDGSIVNMGVSNPDGSICYIIGVLKRIRSAMDKKDGDKIHVIIQERTIGSTEESGSISRKTTMKQNGCQSRTSAIQLRMRTRADKSGFVRNL